MKILQLINNRCGMTHINSGLRRRNFMPGVQKEVLKRKKKHDEVFEDIWKNQMGERFD